MHAIEIRIAHREAICGTLTAIHRGSKFHAISKIQPAFAIQESSKTESILG
jgi:hypothetical protein